MTNASLEGTNCGIAILANDRVLKWLLPFLESYRETNSSTGLFIIPFDENIERTKRAAELYGATLVRDDMRQLDDMAKQLYPLFPRHRRRLRKLQALALPLERVLYIDVDTVIFRDFANFFDRIDPGVTDFIIASTSEGYVYNQERSKHDFLRTVEPFNDGFFLTSNKILSLNDFFRITDEDEKLFHAVRKRGMLFAQPLVNFVVHRLALKVRSLAQCQRTASSESFYMAKDVVFRESGPVDKNGHEIYFAHWAGTVRTPKGKVFDQAWQVLSNKAVAESKMRRASCHKGNELAQIS